MWNSRITDSKLLAFPFIFIKFSISWFTYSVSRQVLIYTTSSPCMDSTPCLWNFTTAHTLHRSRHNYAVHGHCCLCLDEEQVSARNLDRQPGSLSLEIETWNHGRRGGAGYRRRNEPVVRGHPDRANFAWWGDKDGSAGRWNWAPSPRREAGQRRQLPRNSVQMPTAKGGRSKGITVGTLARGCPL